MAHKLLHDLTPIEFFREQLERAMHHQRVSTSAFTEFYLVNLLASCVRAHNMPAVDPPLDETPLALLYVRALHASRHERARLLRALGDSTLFVSGFFADSINRKLVDLDYYRTLGGRAYSSLSHEEASPGVGRQVFSELALRFSLFADLLAEISESSRLTSNHSVLRLYKRWLQTGSRRTGQLLARRGIAPLAPSTGPPQ